MTIVIDYKYNEILLTRYLYTLPLWRRILARYFERFRITKEEYDIWFEETILNKLKKMKSI